jgi:hypothetical protein
MSLLCQVFGNRVRDQCRVGDVQRVFWCRWSHRLDPPQLQTNENQTQAEDGAAASGAVYVP